MQIVYVVHIQCTVRCIAVYKVNLIRQLFDWKSFKVNSGEKCDTLCACVRPYMLVFSSSCKRLFIRKVTTSLCRWSSSGVYIHCVLCTFTIGGGYGSRYRFSLPLAYKVQ